MFLRSAVLVGMLPLALCSLVQGAERNTEQWGSVPLGPKIAPAPFAPAQEKRKLQATLKIHPASGAAVELVQDGRPVCVLMLADNASGSARGAAAILQAGLKKMSGAEVAIVRESKLTLTGEGNRWSISHEGQSIPYLVAIGDTKLAASQGLSGRDLPLEGYRLKTVGNVLLLVGSDVRPHSNTVLEGSRHAAVALLERHLGFRWLWPGELGEIVPRSATVRIPAVDEEDAPAICQRTLRNYGYGHVDTITVPADPNEPGSRPTKKLQLRHERTEAGMKQLGLTSDDYVGWCGLASDWWTRQRLGSSFHGLSAGHAFGGWWNRFGAEHPEWFALQRNGSRTPGRLPAEREKLCLSNPQLVQQVITEKIAELQQDPHRDSVSVSPNDGGGNNSVCLCEACRRLDPVNGNPMPLDAYQSSPGLPIVKGDQRKPGFPGETAGTSPTASSASIIGKKLTVPYVSLSDRTFTFYNQVAEGLAGIHANVDAMSKIGYLYLRRGQWQGKQIIPEEFVSLATGPAAGLADLPVAESQGWDGGASKHYGFLWWNNSDGAIDGVPQDAFWSYGMKDSFIIVVPSLDLVVARAGEYWAPREDPKRSDSYNNILKPFLLPICEAVARCGPYPQSARIPRVTFSDLILHRDVSGADCASGDQWAGTWADDGHLYMGWGDGTGFGHRGEWRDPATVFMGLARLEGTPPHHRGVNVWGGFRPESEHGALYVNRVPQPINLKPADGLIFLNGTLYWYAERKSDGRVDCQLLTSTDYGRSWKDRGRFFQEDGKFAFTGIIQCGQNYSDAPAHLGKYLYLFDGGTKAVNHPRFSRKDMLLARIPLDDLLNRRAVEFFAGTPGQPSWTSDISRAKPVFQDPRGVNAHVSCTYNPAIGRYLLLTMHSHGEGSSRIDNAGFGMFESDRPWGPWGTIYYTDHLESFVPGLRLLINLSLPSKWISPDGRSMWLVFSGRPSDPFYSFNLMKVSLDVTD